MREMLGHLGHLTHHAFVLWYTWLGTSPGGVIAQLLVLFLTEGRGGMLRWEAWRENWQGGLKRGFYALLAVWAVVFAVCITVAVYGDHQSLLAQASVMKAERDQLRDKNAKQETLLHQCQQEESQLQKLRNPPPKTVYVNVPCPTPIQSHVYPQGVPPSRLDKLIETNQRLSAGDRARLADALFDFGKVLDEGQTLFGRLNIELGELHNAWQSGAIVSEITTHRNTLREIDASGKDFYQSLSTVTDKWKYYADQTSYVFGDNPYNDGPNSIMGAAEDYSHYLDDWSNIQNKKDKPVLELFWAEQARVDGFSTRFSNWLGGCEGRLEQMKKSLQ